MPRKYEARSLTIDSLLSWVKTGEIAIPEIQRPFVWNKTKVRNLLDSLYQDYPIEGTVHIRAEMCNRIERGTCIGKGSLKRVKPQRTHGCASGVC
jgi:uncharacterized protein with ParB-like and HNH nuclease domain